MEKPNAFGCYSEDGQDMLHPQFPLHRACRDGDLEALSAILSSGNCDFYEEDCINGWTPVHWAAFSGKLTCLMRMTEHGANCDATTSRLNQAPTHIAAFGGKGHCLKWLLHCGSLINRQLECIRKLSSLTNQCLDKASSRSGQTPVHLSAYSDHPHCIQWLLQSGVRVDCQDFLGDTPIHKSARSGSMECVSLLISQGAKLSLRNHNGRTPSQVAMECGYQECANYLERAMQMQQQATGVYDEMRTPVTQPSNNVQSLNDIKSPTSQEMNGGPVSEHGNDTTDCDMEMDDPSTYKIVNGLIDTGSYDYKINGQKVFPNGHSNGLNHLYTNGHINGESYSMTGGRRKRGCDDLEEESIKRCRVGEPTDRVMYTHPPMEINKHTQNSNHMTTSAIEHFSTVTMQQGYDSLIASCQGYNSLLANSGTVSKGYEDLLYDDMITQQHGS